MVSRFSSRDIPRRRLAMAADCGVRCPGSVGPARGRANQPGGEAPAALPRRAGARKGAWAPRRASLGGPERRRASLARSLLPPLGRFP